MAIQMRAARRAQSNPYMNDAEREELLDQYGYGLEDIPQMTRRASLVRRKQNSVFPTISNAQEDESRGAAGSRAQVASRPGTWPGNTRAASVRQTPHRKTQRDEGEKLYVTRSPVSVYAENGRKRPWIVQFWSKLYPANEKWGARCWRSAGYLILGWFVAFWLVWIAITLLNGAQYGPAHTTQETYVVNNVAYSASAYVQNETVVVTVLENDGMGWKPVYAMTTPQLNSTYWGNDLSAIVPIITDVSSHGVISIQMIGNIDWRFHRPTENVTLTPQTNGTLALAIVSSN